MFIDCGEIADAMEVVIVNKNKVRHLGQSN
jgi:hypothetical protein